MDILWNADGVGGHLDRFRISMMYIQVKTAENSQPDHSEYMDSEEGTRRLSGRGKVGEIADGREKK